jgi:hypothetical protein
MAHADILCLVLQLYSLINYFAQLNTKEQTYLHPP